MLVTYDIPGHTGYMITRDGRVFKKSNSLFREDREIRPRLSSAGYIRVRLVDGDKKPYTVGLHHLLGLTLVLNPDPLTKTMINHKNGIRTDNNLDNLEWVSNKENLLHARETGLIGVPSPCETRCCDTGEVLRFDTFRKMAKYFNVHHDTISYKLRFGETKVFADRRQYRNGHSDKEWYIPKDIDAEIKLGGTSKQIMLRSILDGEIIVFDKQTELAEELNISMPTISNRLDNYNGILPGFYQMKRLSDESEWLSDVEWLEQYQNAGYRAIYAVDTNTGEPSIFSTTSECSKSNGVSMTNLNWWLKAPDKIQCDGKKYSYLNEQGLLYWKQWQDNSSN